MMKLFLVSHESDDGDSLDLFVWAPFSSLAVVFWREYYELEDDEQPAAVFNIPTQAPDEPRAINWNDLPPCPA